MWSTYWWEFTDEDSDMCGEEFFTELEDADAIDHLNYVHNLFPGEGVHCIGSVTAEMAEMMGLDTY